MMTHESNYPERPERRHLTEEELNAEAEQLAAQDQQQVEDDFPDMTGINLPKAPHIQTTTRWENDPPTDRQIDYAFGLCTWLRDNNHMGAVTYARRMRDAVTKKQYRDLIAEMVKAKQEMDEG